MELTGKAAIVTGGASGIGKSVSLQLAARGAHVAIFDVDERSGTEAANEISDKGGRAMFVKCDVTDAKQVAESVARVDDIIGTGLLINCAAIAHIGNVEKTSEEDFDQVYRVNVKGIYNMLATSIPLMRNRSFGVVVNMASIASTVGLRDRFAYSMSKGAVLSMTYSIARDYIDYGIRCNAVSPARVHTPFVDQFLAKNYPDRGEEMFQELSKSQPIGRMGTADEVASLVVYLCSDSASFITGSNFPIDGGFITLNT